MYEAQLCHNPVGFFETWEEADDALEEAKEAKAAKLAKEQANAVIHQMLIWEDGAFTQAAYLTTNSGVQLPVDDDHYWEYFK